MPAHVKIRGGRDEEEEKRVIILKEITKKREFNILPIIIIAIGVIILVAIGYYFFHNYTKEINQCDLSRINEINIDPYKEIDFHTHVVLKILVDGKEQYIPANIGIEPGIRKAVHTEEDKGEIHFESLCTDIQFHLGDFFTIWGKKFNSDCIFDYCTDKGVLKMYVNDKENTLFDKYPVTNQFENITIEYNSSK